LIRESTSDPLQARKTELLDQRPRLAPSGAGMLSP
jgi:hypothetical protein